MIKIPGYDIYRDDRIGRRSGGVAIYASNRTGFMTTKLNTTYNKKHEAAECLWLDIKIGYCNFLICGLYRGQDSTLEQDNRLLEQLSLASENNTVAIMGDFNYGGVRWPLKDCSYVTPSEDNFIQWYESSNLHQIIDKHTRFRQGNQPSFLDLLFTNDDSLISNVEHHAPIGKSDHTCLLASIQLQVRKQNKEAKTRLNYNKADFNKINEKLNESLTSSLQDTNCVKSQFEIIHNAIREAIKAHVPRTTITHHVTNKPWVSLETKKLIKEKRALWNRYVLTGLDEHYTEYRKLNNRLINQTRKARLTHEKEILNAEPKKFYSYIRQQVTSKVSIPSVLLNKQGETVTEPCEIATVFADQFASVFQTEVPDPLPILNSSHGMVDSIDEIIFTQDKIQQAIKDMKTTASPGPDEIPVSILKKCNITDSLAIIMQTSYDTGILPDIWKTAIVTPIFKKGNKLEPSNYRPISLTSVVCKAMEKIIVKHIRHFFTNHKIIPEQQHGFCPHRSTVSNLLACLSSWTKHFNKREPVDVIYLDYEKAFDKVPIRRLLHKLEFVGIRGQLLKWIEAFLRQRTLRVRVGDTLSEHREIHSGVPQGSVLGPVLYILYTFDLPQHLECNVSIFADDTKIFGNPLIDYDRLQEDLNRIANWSKEWLINLNASKCTVLHIGKSNPRLTYNLNSTSLMETKVQTDLGVKIAEDLKWEEHITSTTKKAKTLIYLIRKAFGNLTPDMVLRIHKTFIRPILEYAFQAWNPYFAKDIELLEKVQRRFTKIPRTLKHRRYEERLKMLRLTTLKDRRARGDLIETYKILTGHYDIQDFEHIFTRNDNTHLRGHSLKLCTSFSNNNPHKHFLSNRVVRSWNKLPAHVIAADNINKFKNRLDKHLATSESE